MTLREHTAGPDAEALPLQRKIRPVPENGMTSLFIAFSATMTEVGVTAPCRPRVPTESAPKSRKMAIGSGSVGLRLLAYFWSTALY